MADTNFTRELVNRVHTFSIGGQFATKTKIKDLDSTFDIKANIGRFEITENQVEDAEVGKRRCNLVRYLKAIHNKNGKFPTILLSAFQ